jgi:hypothetical protein
MGMDELEDSMIVALPRSSVKSLVILVFLATFVAILQIAVIEQNVAALHDEISALQQSETNQITFTTPEANPPGVFYLETSYLLYEASFDTLEIVEHIAPRVDAKVQQLQQNFGLSLPLPTEKLKIIVNPTVGGRR